MNIVAADDHTDNVKSQAAVLYLSKNIPISDIGFKYFLQNIKQEFSRFFSSLIFAERSSVLCDTVTLRAEWCGAFVVDYLAPWSSLDKNFLRRSDQVTVGDKLLSNQPNTVLHIHEIIAQIYECTSYVVLLVLFSYSLCQQRCSSRLSLVAISPTNAQTTAAATEMLQA